jgi:Fe-S oxidoreductase
LTLRDEYPALVPGALAEQVAAAALTLDEWLVGFAATPGLGLTWQPRALRVWVHGHCHQKALSGMSPTLRVLRAVPGLEVAEIASGCCGMAGTFGYEAEHLAFSLQVGETRLFPAVRALPPDAVIVADGLSCRGQIEHGTQRPAHHLATVLAGHLAGTHEATGSPAAGP